MDVPRCPDLAHAGGRVVRDGWYGKPPHRRQRWRCRPPNGVVRTASARCCRARRRASISAWSARPAWSAGRARRPRASTGSRVANWVDSLASILTADELPVRWPERLALDSREFRYRQCSDRSWCSTRSWATRRSPARTLSPRRTASVPRLAQAAPRPLARKRRPGGTFLPPRFQPAARGAERLA